MTFLWCVEDHPIARCTYEGTGKQLELKEYTILDSSYDTIWQMVPLPVDGSTLYRAMARRVIPLCRFTPWLKDRYGTTVYNPEVMCRATHGANPQGPFWMKYEDDPEELCYKDVCVQ